MKRAFLLLLAFFAFTRFATAHPFSLPGLDGVAHSDSVYLVQVSSIKAHHEGALNNIITFSVTEVLRGKPRPSLVLTAYEGADFKENSEWLLVHNAPGFKDDVGWAMEGDCEWLPISVTRDGDKVTAQWLGPLDKVREYLREHPYKS